MNEDLKDILSHLNPDIDQATLLEYLQGKLSAEQQHELEKQIMDNEFTSDAFEGLQDFKDKNKITAFVDQLNKELKDKTEKKKRQRRKLEIRIEPWLIVSIVIILILAVISFILVYKRLKHG
jgi:hypothetical protein